MLLQSPEPRPLVAAVLLSPSRLPCSPEATQTGGHKFVPSRLPPEQTAHHPSGCSLGSPPGARRPPLTLQRGLEPLALHLLHTARSPWRRDLRNHGLFLYWELLLLPHSVTPPLCHGRRGLPAGPCPKGSTATGLVVWGPRSHPCEALNGTLSAETNGVAGGLQGGCPFPAGGSGARVQTALEPSFLSHKMVTVWTEEQGQASHGAGQPGFFLGGRGFQGRSTGLGRPRSFKVSESLGGDQRLWPVYRSKTRVPSSSFVGKKDIPHAPSPPPTKLVPNCTFLPWSRAGSSYVCLGHAGLGRGRGADKGCRGQQGLTLGRRSRPGRSIHTHAPWAHTPREPGRGHPPFPPVPSGAASAAPACPPAPGLSETQRLPVRRGGLPGCPRPTGSAAGAAGCTHARPAGSPAGWSVRTQAGVALSPPLEQVQA